MKKYINKNVDSDYYFEEERSKSVNTYSQIILPEKYLYEFNELACKLFFSYLSIERSSIHDITCTTEDIAHLNENFSDPNMPTFIEDQFYVQISKLSSLNDSKTKILLKLGILLKQISEYYASNNMKEEKLKDENSNIEELAELINEIRGQNLTEVGQSGVSQIVFKRGKYKDPLVINNWKVINKLMYLLEEITSGDNNLDILKLAQFNSPNFYTKVIYSLHEILKSKEFLAIDKDLETTDAEIKIIYEILDVSGLKRRWEHYNENSDTIKKIRNIIKRL